MKKVSNTKARGITTKPYFVTRLAKDMMRTIWYVGVFESSLSAILTYHDSVSGTLASSHVVELSPLDGVPRRSC